MTRAPAAGSYQCSEAYGCFDGSLVRVHGASARVPRGKGGGWDSRTRTQGTLEAKFTGRQTYHVEKPVIRMIHREAASEGISITEVVNRAFRAYFARGS
jgi:hypothetical protein